MNLTFVADPIRAGSGAIGGPSPFAFGRRCERRRIVPVATIRGNRTVHMSESGDADRAATMFSANDPLKSAAAGDAAPPVGKTREARGSWTEPKEPLLRGFWNRLLQMLARFAPGAQTVRVFLHRARGVRIGKGVWIGYDVVFDTAAPGLIQIGDGVSISMRATVIAHFKELRGVRIEEEAFIGPGAIILPNIVIGMGSVIKAGSVVSQSVPPLTIVEGNPATVVGRCEIPLAQDVSLKEFARTVRALPASMRKSNRSENI